MAQRLHAIAPQIWHATQDNTLPGGVHLPVRMVVVQLPSGGLWLHSAIPIDDALAGELAAIGPVEHIVVPNLFHNMFAAAAKTRYPDAQLHAPARLRKKLPKLPIDADLGEVLSDWADVLDSVALRGAPMVDEHVFLHRPSGTLITTDMVFNFQQIANWQTRLLLWMVGCSRGLSMSRSWRFLFVRDATLMAGDAARVLAWEFDRVTMGHGEIVQSGGHDMIRAAIGWLLARALPPPSDA